MFFFMHAFPRLHAVLLLRGGTIQKQTLKPTQFCGPQTRPCVIEVLLLIYSDVHA